MQRSALHSWLSTLVFALVAVGVVVLAPRLQSNRELVRDVTQVNRLVEERWVGEVPEDELRFSAIEGMLRNLDDYSELFRPEDVAELREDNEGTFGGLGIYVRQRDDRTVIETVLTGHPAAEAGLLDGDVIVSVDGARVEGLRRYEVVRRLKGQVDTSVVVGIHRPGEVDEREFTIVRKEIKVDSVRGTRMIDEERGIGYTRLLQFQENSADDLHAAIEGLRAQGMRSLVLDLRQNPGGVLQGAIDIAGIFLPEDTLVVRTIDREDSESYRVTDSRGGEGYPLAILVNEKSASASEIVAAAVQDHGRGVLVGARTFGKASVQSLIPIAGGDALLKLTTARYETPGGRIIHRGRTDTEEDDWGLIPDVAVPFDTDVFDMLTRVWEQEYLDRKAEKPVEIEEIPPLPKAKIAEAAESLRPLAADSSEIRAMVERLDQLATTIDPYSRALAVFRGEEPDTQLEEALSILRDDGRYRSLLESTRRMRKEALTRTARRNEADSR